MSATGEGFVTRRAGPSPFADGATAGVGSVPHRDPDAAAAFSIAEFDIATVPALPRRSMSETMISQAVTGVDGLSIDLEGDVVIEPGFDADGGPVITDLRDDAFTGFRAFLDLADKVHLDRSPIKWQFVGPVTLGVGLERAGVERTTAFELAGRIVRAHVAALSDTITAALPNSPQMVVLDEPWLGDLMTPGFPIPPDQAVDLVSSAMAALPPTTLAGIHCCAPCDVATLLASGPSVISLPVSPDLVDWVGYLTRYLDDGGIIAWGVIPTDGPVPSIAERPWRALSDLWCSLVQLGCDPVLLRRQSIVTPACGLAFHSVSVARRIARLSADVGKRVKDQSSATRFALGA